MFKQILITQYLKDILLILLISIPPWVVLVSNMKKRKNKKQKKFLTITFILYLGITVFTNNILPTILAVIYMIYVYKNKNKVEEAYYLRPLKKKIYKFKRQGKETTIIISKDRLNIILQSIIFKILITAVSFWFVFLLSMNGIKVENQIVVSEFLSASTLKSIYLIILMIITAPILEEFIFRHIFYRLLKDKTGKIISAILTSALFTLLHYNIAGIVMFFGVGMYNCYLYEKYGYRAALINHFIFNITSLIALLYMKNLV